MFSNLTQNSVIYIMDLNNNPKIVTGLIENISLPRPKYNTLNPSFETVVDIVANVAGEKREFKNVPNNSVANFGEAAFVLAENKEVLNSYITSMLQNSERAVESVEKHKQNIVNYKTALNELNPDRTDSKVIQDLQSQITTLQNGMNALLEKLNGNSN